jgi:hypothetical protein
MKVWGGRSDWPISASPESPDSQPTSQAHNVSVRRKRSTSRGAAMTPYLRVRRAVFHACWARSTTSKASWSAGSVRLPGGEAQPRPAFCFRGPEIYRDPISDFIEIWPNWSAHGPPSWRLVHRADHWPTRLHLSRLPCSRVEPAAGSGRGLRLDSSWITARMEPSRKAVIEALPRLGRS